MEAEECVWKAIRRDDAGGLVAALSGLKGAEVVKKSKALALSLLHAACKLDSLACLCRMLARKRFARAVNRPDPECGKTALHQAAEHHSARCIQALIRSGANPSAQTSSGDRPLDLALKSNRMKVGWSIDDDVISLVAEMESKNLYVIQALTICTVEAEEIAIGLALRGEIVAFAALLVAGDADLHPDIWDTTLEKLVSKILEHQVHPDSPKVAVLLKEVELLLRSDPSMLETFPWSSYHLLNKAVQVGNSSIVDLLLNAGAGVSIVDEEGNAPLHQCFLSNLEDDYRIWLMHRLIANGASVVQGGGSLGMTPVHLAASRGYSEELKVLLKRDPLSVGALTISKETPLYFAARNNHLECARLLLQYGALLQVFNLRKQRPVEVASSPRMRALLASPATAPVIGSSKPSPAKITNAPSSPSHDNHDDQEADAVVELETIVYKPSPSKNLEIVQDWNHEEDAEEPTVPAVEEIIAEEASSPESTRETCTEEMKVLVLGTLKAWLSTVLHPRRAYSLCSLPHDFEVCSGVKLDYQALGFDRLIYLAESMPDVCRISYAPAMSNGVKATHVNLYAPSWARKIWRPMLQPGFVREGVSYAASAGAEGTGEQKSSSESADEDNPYHISDWF